MGRKHKILHAQATFYIHNEQISVCVCACKTLCIEHWLQILYAQHESLERAGLELENLKNFQKGWGSENFHYKECLDKKDGVEIISVGLFTLNAYYAELNS